MKNSFCNLFHISFLLLAFSLRSVMAAQDANALPALIYVPYDHIPESVLSGSVMMPYEHYLHAWKESPHQPPIAAVLSSFSLTGTLGEETCSLTLSVEVSALADSWSHIDLPSDLPLTKFLTNDPRVALERSDDGVHLHLPTAGTYHLTAELLYSVIHNPDGGRSIILKLPLSAAGSLDLELPVDTHSIMLEPLVAQISSIGAKGSHLHCALGGSPEVTISWHPLIVNESSPLVLSQENSIIRCSVRNIQEDVAFNLKITRQSISDCNIDLPRGLQLLTVEGPNVQNWEQKDNSLKVIFNSPQSVESKIRLHLEQELSAIPAGESRNISVALPKITSAVRTSGSAAIIADDANPVTIAIDSHVGYAQVDPSRIGMDNASAAFTFLSPPVPLNVRLTQETPDLRCRIEQLIQLGVQADRIDVLIKFEIRKSGIYSCSCLCPASWELQEIHGNGVEIDDSHVGAIDHGIHSLQIAFKNRLLGSGELWLQFHAPPKIPRSIASNVSIGDLQVISVEGALQTHGEVVVMSPENWAISSQDRIALMGTEIHPLISQASWQSLMPANTNEQEMAMAFTWAQGLGETGPNPVPLAKLLASARPREVNVHVSDEIVVGDGAVHETITWHGEVRFSAITSFRIAVPSAWDKQVVFHGNGIAERNQIPHFPHDDQTTWEIRFEQPVLGIFNLSVDHSLALPPIRDEKPQKLTLDVIKDLDSTSSSRIVAIAREGALEVNVEDPGVTPIAPSDVPSELQHEGTVAAFQGENTTPISLTVFHRDDVRLADAAVTLARYLAVVGEDGILRVHGSLHLESRGRPSFELHLPMHAELLELAIDQHQGHPSRRADGTIIVPLPSVNDVSSLLVSFVYSLALTPEKLSQIGSLHVQLPSMGDDDHSQPFPIQQVLLNLYIPNNLFSGYWRGDLLPVDDNFMSTILEPDDDGLTVHIATSGTHLDFTRLGGGGEIDFWYFRDTCLWFLSIVNLLIGTIILYIFRRIKYSAMALAIFGLASMIFMAITVSLAFSYLFSFFTAVCVTIAIWHSTSPWRIKRRAWRSTEALVGDNPWLDPAVPSEQEPLFPQINQENSIPSDSSPMPNNENKTQGNNSPPQDPT